MSLLLILTLLGWNGTVAQAEVISPITVEFSTTTAPLILNAFAAKYGIDFEEFLAVAKCESGLKADAIGDQGSSYGLFQIHLPAHTEITREQAMDPWFSTQWAAQQFAMGNAKIWTCYKLQHPKTGV